MVSVEGSELGTNDIWMNGHIDADENVGKVSYLAGHRFGTNLPMSTHPGTQGTRYFLNSLFEAPCSSAEGQPNPSIWIDGPGGTNHETYTTSACYENAGPGLAFDAVLTLELPEGATFISATEGGVESGGMVTWELGTLAAGAGGCPEVTVSFPAHGSYGFSSTLTYYVGLNEESVDSGAPEMVRFASINLLRHAIYDPANWHEAFVAQYPEDPAMDPEADVEVIAFFSGISFPHDVSDLQPGSPALVFYELDDEPGDTLRVDRDATKVVITY
jgi:hypothetical protein